MAITKIIKVTAKEIPGRLPALTRLIVMLLAIVPLASYAVTMKQIGFSSLPGDKTEIKMTFDGPPPKPTGYTIEQPARIALDLMGVSSDLKSKYHSLGTGNARSVTVIQAGDRTRVIVAMTDLTPYSTRIAGDSLYLLVGKGDSQGAMLTAKPTFPAERNTERNQTGAQNNDSNIENIDFRRGEHGEGRVVVKLSNPGIGIDVSSLGGKIRVEFSNTNLPKSLQRRLDVTDFATPVVSVDALPDGENTVITVKPTGDYDYLAYQADDIFTLEVKPQTAQEAATDATDHFKYHGKKLSLNFQDIDVRAVLQLIADFTNLNLVASDTVTGTITLRLKNVPWDQALDIILRTKGLAKRQLGNVLMVAPAAELAARDKMEIKSKLQAAELAPLKTEFIPVRYAKAGDLVSLFKNTGPTKGANGVLDTNNGNGQGNSNDDSRGGVGFVSSRGSIAVDKRTNSIIITDTVAKINELRKLLEKLDVPVRQVMIEARIVEVDSNNSQNLGIKWGIASRASHDNGNTLTQIGANVGSLSKIADAQTSGGSLSGIVGPDSLSVDLGSAGSTSQIAFGFLRDNILLDLELDALESEGKSESIARPRVITSDKQTAHIEQGSQVPYQQATSSGATSVSFASATLSLDVTPQITPDNRILLDLKVKNDGIGAAAANGQPIINTKRVDTQVLVNNGETVVLGGVYTSNNSQTVNRTPLLSRIQILGGLFRQTIDSSGKKETLIFITPRLIKDQVTSR